MLFFWKVVSIGEWGVFITMKDSLLSCIHLFKIKYVYNVGLWIFDVCVSSIF